MRAVQAHARLPGLVVELGLQEQRLLSKGNTSALHCVLLRGMILATRMTFVSCGSMTAKGAGRTAAARAASRRPSTRRPATGPARPSTVSSRTDTRDDRPSLLRLPSLRLSAIVSCRLHSLLCCRQAEHEPPGCQGLLRLSRRAMGQLECAPRCLL